MRSQLRGQQVLTDDRSDTEEQLELLAVARRLERECRRPGCSEPRTGPAGYLPDGDAGAYCERHGDAL
jgi:hypothetical protein